MSKKRLQKKEVLTVTRAQLEILKYRAAGLSFTEIARKTHKSAPVVSRSLSCLDNVYDDLHSFVIEIEQGNLIRKMREQKLDQTRYKVPAFMRAMEEKKVKGGYFLGVVPCGYKKENGKLIQTEEAPKIKQIYEEFDNHLQDITLGELARKFEMTRTHITYILKNPVYKGYMRYRGISIKGDHEPIVNEELWDRVQKKVVNRRYGQRSLPAGYRYVEAHPVIDSQVAQKIKQMFQLAANGLGRAEIGRRLAMDFSAVQGRIKNPYYANKKFVKGRWVDDDHEAIVDFETWKTANRPRSKENWEEAVKLRRQIKTHNKSKILACLGMNEKTLGEIAKETGLAKSTVYNQLLRCQKEGLTDKNPPGREKGKWRIRK